MIWGIMMSKYISLLDAILKATQEGNFGYIDTIELKGLKTIDITTCDKCLYCERVYGSSGKEYLFCTKRCNMWVEPDFFCKNGREK